MKNSRSARWRRSNASSASAASRASIMTFRSGCGDYTADRHQWLSGLTLEDIRRELNVGQGK
jgi:hypothetical protein